MSDQVKSLNQAGVHAAYINSSLTENQIRTALSYAANGKYKVIYVAPERLNTMRFLEFACYADISMVTVDEAHCISQWGQDFRPSYLEIAGFLAKLPKRPIVSAFTATATERVKQDITKSLHLQDPVTVVTGFDRPNLFFRVVNRKGGKETDNSILNYVKRHEDESGIIYCATKKNVDSVYALLLQYGIAAGHYHADYPWRRERRIRMILPMTVFVSWLPQMPLEWALTSQMCVMCCITICLRVWNIIIRKQGVPDVTVKKRNVSCFTQNRIL